MNNTKEKIDIISTIGPSSCESDVLSEMMLAGMTMARFNYSWGDFDTFAGYINTIRDSASKLSKEIKIIGDLSGPRIQETKGHKYDANGEPIPTKTDLEFIKFSVEHELDFLALSFVGSKEDVLRCKKAISDLSGTQKVISKIERKVAFQNLDEILEVSDCVMVARGDLGQEIPLEELPFVEKEIIERCNRVGKPVVTATGLLLSMMENTYPSRSEVTDIAFAVLNGTDAVMLSEESATGKNPVLAVSVMKKVIDNAREYSI